jgi:hypothetical protein
MTTTTTTNGVPFASAATLLAGHLAEHALPEPVSLSVTTSHGDSTVTAQLPGTTLAGVAGDLLRWADTLSVDAVEAWHPPERDWVHLSIRSTLTGPAGAVELKVFGCVDYDPHSFDGLRPDPHQGMLLSLGDLQIWAAHPDPTADTPLPTALWGDR